LLFLSIRPASLYLTDFNSKSLGQRHKSNGDPLGERKSLGTENY
jgi:hypothetical protein